MQLPPSAGRGTPAQAASGRPGQPPACAVELGGDELLQCKVGDTESAWVVPELDDRMRGPGSCAPSRLFAQEVVKVVALGLLAVPGLQLWPKQEVQYTRTPRSWLGLRGGRLVQVVQPEPWHSPPGVAGPPQLCWPRLCLPEMAVPLVMQGEGSRSLAKLVYDARRCRLSKALNRGPAGGSRSCSCCAGVLHCRATGAGQGPEVCVSWRACRAVAQDAQHGALGGVGCAGGLPALHAAAQGHALAPGACCARSDRCSSWHGSALTGSSLPCLLRAPALFSAQWCLKETCKLLVADLLLGGLLVHGTILCPSSFLTVLTQACSIQSLKQLITGGAVWMMCCMFRKSW